ncbi:MAG: nSTAND1 domain-containing NTPase [Pyrinomonadaceae bacterium]
MATPSTEDILKKVEASESFINKLVIAWQQKQWVRLLLLFGFVSLSFLNPSVISKCAQFILSNPNWQPYRWYFYVWLVITLASFIVAFLVALRTRPTSLPNAPSEKSIIKGLRPYTKHDSELFAKLQRGRILQDCLAACTDGDFRFGILNGESGTGKTSFLQAGLCPALEKRGYRTVYVKLTNDSPLDSIRQALTSQNEIKPESTENQSLLELLQRATNGRTEPVVLILEQFEQFFVNHKSKDDRRPFIQEMALWYEKRDSLPVKLLISIRGDFVYRLGEFQEVIGYTLAPQDNFRLEKFEPKEAASIFRVIAAEEKIECDEDFIEELTTNELSDSNDGLVSPVDVQVLSWMVAGQKTETEKGFNRKAFQRLGGVEGLLESFLKKTLDARETSSRRQNAVKVLLALIDLDKNTRAGALSLDDLRTKLIDALSAQDIEESISWLSSGGVRLVTPINQHFYTTYELAHERLIPALRKLANQELVATDRASQILDRRFNEWIGNSYSWRYLLTLKEWRLIEQNRTLISWEPKRVQKEHFFRKSRKWFIQCSLLAASVFLLALGLQQAYRVYDNRPEAQISHIQERLYSQLEKGKHDTLKEAVLMTPILESGDQQDKLLNEKIWRLVDRLDAYNRSKVIAPLAIKYHELGEEDKALKLFAEIETDSKNHRESSARYSVPIEFADLCWKLGKKDEALNVLSQVEDDVRYDKEAMNDVFMDLANSYRDLDRQDKSLKLLEAVRVNTNHLPAEVRHVIVTILAQAYSKLEPNDQVLGTLGGFLNESKNSSYHRNVISACLTAYNKLKEKDKALYLLSQLEKEINQLLTPYEAMIQLAELYDKFGQRDKSLELLTQVQKEVEKEHPRYKSLMLIITADSFMKFGLAEQGLSLLAQMRDKASSLEPKAKLEVLGKVMDCYIRHNQKKDALILVQQIQADMENSALDPESLDPFVDSYGKLDQEYQESIFLADVQKEVKSSAGRGDLLIKIATRYAELGEWIRAREAASDIGDESAEITALMRMLAVWKSPNKAAS